MNFLKIPFYYLYIIVSIISNSYTYENLPLWVNNAQLNSLLDDLSNSEIISYISSNYTNTTLYLINNNNKTFFCLEGKNIHYKRYKNDLKEELIFLSPPLVE